METRDTILVVDDTTDVADPLRDALTGAGYRVLVAPTLDVGLQIIAAFVVRAVLIDAPTPYGDDPDAGDFWADLDRLAIAARPMPLVIYAGENPERYAEYAAHGYAAYLTKPLDLDALLATVAGLLQAGQDDPTIAHGTATAGKGRGHAQHQVVKVERLRDMPPHPAPRELLVVHPRRHEQDRDVRGLRPGA